MSHVSQIELKIKNLDSLKIAAVRLGGTLIMGQKTFRSYYRNETCSHAIHFDDATFEIGIIEKDGEFTISWDNWQSGGLEGKVGKNAGLLKQAYTVEHAKATARRAGYRNIKEKRTFMDRVRGALRRQQVNGIRLTIS